MSCNEWEEGTIKLPTAEFARVRKALEDADRTRKERVFAQTQVFWKGLTRKAQTNHKEYESAAYDFTEKLGRSTSRDRYGFSADGPDADLADDLRDALQLPYAWDPATRERVEPKPGRVLPADMKYPTNRTTAFHADDASIIFTKDTSSVTWSVGENNHAVERAREQPIAQAFFGELRKVRWTRGTGGIITGNDEYNREDRSSGGGGNTTNQGLGPVGAADPDAYNRTDDYLDSFGHRVGTDGFPGRKAAEKHWKAMARASGPQGRKPRGAASSTGGQFSVGRRSEPGFGLSRY